MLFWVEHENFLYPYIASENFIFELMPKILDMHMFLLTCLVDYFRHAHPGSPYVFGLVGVDHDLDFPEPMPVVGKNTLYFLPSKS